MFKKMSKALAVLIAGLSAPATQAVSERVEVNKGWRVFRDIKQLRTFASRNGGTQSGAAAAKRAAKKRRNLRARGAK